MKKTKTVTHIFIYGAFFAFCIWMAAQIPYTHDDWDWGISNGIEQLLGATLNARYVGNFFVVIMTGSKFLKTLIMGMGYFLIPYGLSSAAVWKRTENHQERKMCTFLLTGVLLFMLPREIWQQTYSWVSGFANYSVSAVFLLVWIREIGLAFSLNAADRTVGLWELLLCCLGSFLLQMFLENLAIYTVLLGIFLCGIYFFRDHKVPLKNVLMLLCAIVGLFIMFSSRIYESLWSVGETVNGYRSLSVGTQYGLTNTIYMLLSQAARLAPLVFEKNTILCLVILIMLSILLLQKRGKMPGAYILCCINGLFLLYILYSYLGGDTVVGLGVFTPLVVNSAFFLTVAGETTILLRENKSILAVALSIWFSVPGVILPLVFTLETGERLFFTSDVFMAYFAALLFQELAEFVCLKRIKFFLMTGTLLLMCCYGCIYHAIGTCSRERDALMAQATRENADVVMLPGYPYEEYLWAPNPAGEKRQGFFRTFYGLPQDIEIQILH